MRISLRLVCVLVFLLGLSRLLAGQDISIRVGSSGVARIPGPGVSITPVSGLITTEAGGTAVFYVVLTVQPYGNVTVNLSSSDTTEGNVSTSALAFTTSNWNQRQPVTVTGVDDGAQDGPIGYTVLTSTTSTADPEYNGIDVVDVSVTNSDNDDATPPGCTTTTSDAQFATVAAAISAASTGDTICVPAGSATWSSVLTLSTSKDVILTGSGGGQTLITCSGTCIDLPVSQTIRVTGFGFTTVSDQVMNHRVNGAVSGKYHRIDHNTFTKTGGGYSSVDITAEPNGNCSDSPYIVPSVIYDHNTLTDVRVFSAGTPCSWGDGPAQHRIWSQDPRPNAPTGVWPLTVYIEANTFVGAGGIINILDCNYAGSYIARFNTLTAQTGVSRGYMEIHGVQGASRACQWHEIYHNTVEDVGQNNFFGLLFKRAGSGVVFNNTSPAGAQEMRFNNQRSTEDPGGGVGKCDGNSTYDGNSGLHGYPCRDQIGRIRDDSYSSDGKAPQSTLVPMYFWRNLKGGSTQDVPKIHPDTSTELADHIIQNREWYTENTSFNGTTGVGVGTLAARPSSCTTGVAYWATDQGEWDSTHGGNDGQLYKCTSTNTWTLYYIPYTYPHPLTQ